jgi:hypothetical protein
MLNSLRTGEHIFDVWFWECLAKMCVLPWFHACIFLSCRWIRLPLYSCESLSSMLRCYFEWIWMQGMCSRAIRASHILVSSCGQACLSGLRYACQIVEHGRWQCSVHSFPRSTACNLNWLSPEVLEQVSIASNYTSPFDRSTVLSLVH